MTEAQIGISICFCVLSGALSAYLGFLAGKAYGYDIAFKQFWKGDAP